MTVHLTIWVRLLHPWGAPAAPLEVRLLHHLVRLLHRVQLLRGVHFLHRVRHLHPVQMLRGVRLLHPCGEAMEPADTAPA